MIRSLELINWKTHKHSVLDFKKGVNLMIGIMGSGKSSIVDAISFGFFGTTPSLNQRRISLENLITNMPLDENEAEVKIKFDIGDDLYEISRKISRNSGSSATLYKNGKYLQAQSTKVNEEIEELLKIDYDMFSRAIYAEQNRINYFIELAKGERKRQLDRMLGLDHFALAEENTTSFINLLKSSIKEGEQTLSQIDIGSYKAQLTKLEEEMHSLDAEQKTLTQESTVKAETLSKSRKELETLKATYEKKRLVEKAISELKSKIDTLNIEIGKLSLAGVEPERVINELKVETQKKESLDNEIRTKKESERLTSKSLAEANANIKNIEERIKERDRTAATIKGKMIDEIEKRGLELDITINKVSNIIASGKAKVEELTIWTEELAKHISRCPVCERELNEELKLKLLEGKKSGIKKIEEEIKEKKSELEKLKVEAQKVKIESNKVKIANERLKDYAGLDEKFRSYKVESDKHSKSAENIRSEIENISKSLEQIVLKINQMNILIESVKTRRRHEESVSAAKLEMAKKSEEIKSMIVDQGLLYKIQETIAKQSSELAEVRSKLDANSRYLKGIADQIDQKSKEISKLDAIQKEISHKRDASNNLSKFKYALVETEATLRNRLISSINSLMAELWPRLYPYEDYSGIRISAKKDDYLLELKTNSDNENNGWVSVERIASGGERSISSLTMRIAISMVIVPNLKWIILDEPTHNIDSRGIEKIIHILGDSLPNLVEQLFIITHDESLKSINEAKIFELDRDKATNGHTTILES